MQYQVGGPGRTIRPQFPDRFLICPTLGGGLPGKADRRCHQPLAPNHVQREMTTSNDHNKMKSAEGRTVQKTNCFSDKIGAGS